jgi:hypothetical protein
MTTSSDTVTVLSAGQSATFASEHLVDTGYTRVQRLELRNLTNAIATYVMGGNGPIRSLVPYEVYILERGADIVLCDSGTIEVTFQL